MTNEKALDWIVGNDTGSSSKALWAFMMGRKTDGSYPHDPADLGRCLRLLELVPEWKVRIPEMASVSPYWAALVSRWLELASTMAEEAGPQFNNRVNATKTYALMKVILDPIEKADRRVFSMGNGVTMRFGA